MSKNVQCFSFSVPAGDYTYIVINDLGFKPVSVSMYCAIGPYTSKGTARQIVGSIEQRSLKEWFDGGAKNAGSGGRDTIITVDVLQLMVASFDAGGLTIWPVYNIAGESIFVLGWAAD